jgi:hypothetical protein
LQLFGWNQLWNSGDEFGGWWLEVFESLRKDFPEGRFGFPGVLPGGQVPGHRLDAEVFLDGADQAMLRADWIGVNCYWNNEIELDNLEGGKFYDVIRKRYPEKLLFITEFGNVNLGVGSAAKGQEYLNYFGRLREKAGIGAAFAQVVSSADGYDGLVWRSEDGSINEISQELGNRQF